MRSVVFTLFLSILLASFVAAMEKEAVIAPSQSTFADLETLYRAYQTKPNKELRVSLITKLNQLLLIGDLDKENVEEALKMAKDLKAENLAMRIRKYDQDLVNQVHGQVLSLPKELIDHILGYFIQGSDIKEVIEMLRISKGFNMALLRTPLDIDLSKYGEAITDDILGKIVATFPYITSLNLMKTDITDDGLVYLQNLGNLTVLSLYSSDISEARFAHLQDMRHFQKLNLGDTLITDAGLIHLRNLGNLTELYLGGRAITDAGLVQLQNLTNLTKLSLFFCKITDDGLAYLQTFRNLTSLDLSLTSIEDAARLKELLNNLPNLSTLNIRGTLMTDDAIDDLIKSYPHLDIQK